jgi:HEAT repeat protein
MINRLSKEKSRISSPSASKPAATRAAAETKTTVTMQVERLQASDWTARSAAAAELGKLGDRQATKALSTALRDSAAEVAREAAAALGRLRDVAAVEALAAVVVNADGYFDWSVRVAAANSLEQLQDRRAVEVLIATVRDQAAEVSEAAVRALGLLGDERAAEPLAAIVRNQSNYFLPAVRQAAVEALGHLRVPTARESLRKIAADAHIDPTVRQAASAALAVTSSTN